MLKKAQEEVNTANFKSVQNGITQINQIFTTILGNLDQAIVLIRSLLSNYEYQPGSPFFSETEMFRKEMTELQTFIQEQKKTNLQFLRQILKMPPQPNEQNLAAQNIYNALKLKISIVNRSLREVAPHINKTIQLMQVSQQQAWTKPLMGILMFYKQFLEVIRNTQINQLAGLEEVVKFAYPVTYHWAPRPKPENVKLWKETKVKIDAFKRVYSDYTFPQVLYHFTKDWDMFERFKFKKWYKYHNSESKMNRVATADFVVQDQQQKLVKKKKQLQSRVDSAKKILREMINNGLLEKEKSNKIFKILAMLEYEILHLSLRTASARTTRAIKQIHKLGCAKIAEVLGKEDEIIVKTAKADVQRTTKLLKMIKEVLTATDYSKNLDKMYNIKRELEDMGRTGDTESVLKIIKDELDGLDKLNKRLVDVYVNLSRLPIEEMSEKEDETLLEDAQPQKIKMPLAEKEDVEIIEEDKVPPKVNPPPSFKQPSKPLASPMKKSPVRPLAPKIDKNIPNV